jgi:ankyrin repeat protein
MLNFIIQNFEWIALIFFLMGFFIISRVARGTGRYSAIMMACRLGDEEEVRYLLRDVPWLSMVPDATNTTPMHVAALKGHTSIVHILIRHKADVNAQNSSGMTPLHAAAMGGHLECVRLLLNNGSAIDLKDCRGNTPLFLAVWDGHIDVVKLLIDRGADMHLETDNGEDALARAAQHGHIEIEELLNNHAAKSEKS